MSTEENKLLSRRFFEEGFKNGNLTAGDGRCPAPENEALARTIFGFVLTLVSEPPKLLQMRQMLASMKEQSGLPEDFSNWATAQLEERVTSMALEYVHDAEILLQMLSFKGGTLDRLRHAIEDLYQQEQISGRVYVKARLLLRTSESPEPE